MNKFSIEVIFGKFQKIKREFWKCDFMVIWLLQNLAESRRSEVWKLNHESISGFKQNKLCFSFIRRKILSAESKIFAMGVKTSAIIATNGKSLNYLKLVSFFFC